jgi:hypothetical protein
MHNFHQFCSYYGKFMRCNLGDLHHLCVHLPHIKLFRTKYVSMFLMYLYAKFPMRNYSGSLRINIKWKANMKYKLYSAAMLFFSLWGSGKERLNRSYIFLLLIVGKYKVQKCDSLQWYDEYISTSIKICFSWFKIMLTFILRHLNS